MRNRSDLVALALQRLHDEQKHLQKCVGWDLQFIEEKMDMLKELPMDALSRPGIEAAVAERMIRVDNLRLTEALIALCQELLATEEKRLGGQPTLFEVTA